MSTQTTTRCDQCGCYLQQYTGGYHLSKCATIMYCSLPPSDNGINLDFCTLTCLYRWLENTPEGKHCKHEDLVKLS